jgi:CheY-like chemotaxis protein
MGGRRSILVVEDDADFRESLVAFLSSEGYAVTSAADGQEAIDRLQGGFPASLIFLDLMLPTMDAWEFRVRQKQDPALTGIPVIVMSCHGDMRRKAEPLDAIDYLEKPIDFDAVRALANRYS